MRLTSAGMIRTPEKKVLGFGDHHPILYFLAESGVYSTAVNSPWSMHPTDLIALENDTRRTLRILPSSNWPNPTLGCNLSSSVGCGVCGGGSAVPQT
jgi:hypothetical protein